MVAHAATAEQENVVDTIVRAVTDAKPAAFLVQAVAGAGKSYTLVAALRAVLRIHPTSKILMLVFNVEMANELRKRLGPDSSVEIHTLHSFGLRLIRSEMNMDELRIDPIKMYRLYCLLRGGRFPETVSEWMTVLRAVDQRRHRGEFPHGPRPYTLVNTLLEASLSERDVLDHEDQIYHTLFYEIRPVGSYDLVLIDESQGRWPPAGCLRKTNLNEANLRLIHQCFANTVLCAVGDQYQLFSGATLKEGYGNWKPHLRERFVLLPHGRRVGWLTPPP